MSAAGKHYTGASTPRYRDNEKIKVAQSLSMHTNLNISRPQSNNGNAGTGVKTS